MRRTHCQARTMLVNSSSTPELPHANGFFFVLVERLLKKREGKEKEKRGERGGEKREKERRKEERASVQPV